MTEDKESFRFILVFSRLSQHSLSSTKSKRNNPHITFAMAFSPCEGYFNAGDQSRFENMMKLLLFLEAELQLKEEIIDLLLVCIVQF